MAANHLLMRGLYDGKRHDRDKRREHRRADKRRKAEQLLEQRADAGRHYRAHTEQKQQLQHRHRAAQQLSLIHI